MIADAEIHRIPEETSKLLESQGADPSSSASQAAALEEVLQALGEGLHSHLGRERCRNLFQQAYREAAVQSPLLERYFGVSEGAPFSESLIRKLAQEKPEKTWKAMNAFLGELLRHIRALGRGTEIMLGGNGSGSRTLTREGRMARSYRDTGRKGSGAGDGGVQPETRGDGKGRGKRETARDRRSREPWRIMVMDRDRATCEAIAMALEEDEDFRSVGYGFTPADIRETMAEEEVDVVIVSARLPPEHLLEVAHQLRRDGPSQPPHMVITGMPKDPVTALRFMESGSPAFIMEDLSLEGLRLTLRLLGRGEVLFSPRLQYLMALRLSELAEIGRDRGLDIDALSKLTPREREILDLLEGQLTNRKIAKKLFVSEGTVKSHVHQILKKLKVRDRKEAVRLLRLHRARRRASSGDVSSGETEDGEVPSVAPCSN